MPSLIKTHFISQSSIYMMWVLCKLRGFLITLLSNVRTGLVSTWQWRWQPNWIIHLLSDIVLQAKCLVHKSDFHIDFTVIVLFTENTAYLGNMSQHRDLVITWCAKLNYTSPKYSVCRLPVLKETIKIIYLQQIPMRKVCTDPINAKA